MLLKNLSMSWEEVNCVSMDRSVCFGLKVPHLQPWEEAQFSYCVNLTVDVSLLRHSFLWFRCFHFSSPFVRWEQLSWSMFSWIVIRNSAHGRPLPTQLDTSAFQRFIREDQWWQPWFCALSRFSQADNYFTIFKDSLVQFTFTNEEKVFVALQEATRTL